MARSRSRSRRNKPRYQWRCAKKIENSPITVLSKKKTEHIDDIKDILLDILNNTFIPANKKRENVRRDGEGALRSVTFGQIFCFGKNNADPSGNNKQRYQLSQYSIKHPELHDILFLLAKRLTGKNYKSCCLNDSYRMAKHVDNNNYGTSFIWGVGDFTGGELRVYGENDTYTDYDIRNGLFFDGSVRPHEVLQFEGRRFSMVFYDPNMDLVSR